MKISDIINKNSIAVGLKAKNKEALLNKMMDLAMLSGNVTDRDEAQKQIFERENIMSTGVGKGIALPHAKTNCVEDMVGALAILDSPLDYEAIDGKPVNIVFLLLGQENNVGNHLRLLSRISKFMNNDTLRNKLSSSRSPGEILKLIQEVEETI